MGRIKMAMITLTTMPVSTNAMYRGGPRYLTEKARATKEAMGWEVKKAWSKPPLTGAVRLKIALYWPDMRRHDIDNNKALFDALTGILYEDDSQITELHLSKHFDKANPRVELEIESLE